MFSEVAEIALVATRLGQFQQLLKTRVILIQNFTRPHAITYTNCTPLSSITIIKHDVYGRRQTANITSDYLFSSCDP